MRDTTSRPATSAPLPKPKSMGQSMLQLLLPFIVVTLFLWRFSTLPTYHPNIEYPADWTPGCPQWEATWHTVTVPQVDRAGAAIYAPVPEEPDHFLVLQYQSPAQHMQFARYNIATGSREAETLPQSRFTSHWLRDGVLVQAVPGTTGWPAIVLADPMTLQTTRTIPLSGDPALLRKLPTKIGFRDGTFTKTGEMRILAFVPGSGSQDGRHFWIATDPSGHITSLRQTPE